MNGPDRFNLARPCKGCPFRVDGEPVLLSAERRDDIAASLERDEWFTCHATHEDEGAVAQCAGATMLQMRAYGRPNQLVRVAGRLGMPVADIKPHQMVPWEDPWHWAAEMADVDTPRKVAS
jgi:hypothetical protein